jgi:hypothetical protein
MWAEGYASQGVGFTGRLPTPRIQQTLKKRPATDPKIPAIKRVWTGAALALNRGDDPENRVNV